MLKFYSDSPWKVLKIRFVLFCWVPDRDYSQQVIRWNLPCPTSVIFFHPQPQLHTYLPSDSPWPLSPVSLSLTPPLWHSAPTALISKHWDTASSQRPRLDFDLRFMWTPSRWNIATHGPSCEHQRTLWTCRLSGPTVDCWVQTDLWTRSQVIPLCLCSWQAPLQSLE